MSDTDNNQNNQQNARGQEIFSESLLAAALLYIIPFIHISSNPYFSIVLFDPSYYKSPP